MKFLKNVLLIALCIMLVLPTLPAFAATTVVSESFDDLEPNATNVNSYGMVDPLLGGGDQIWIAGDWYIRKGSGALLGRPLAANIEERNGNKMLAMTGITTHMNNHASRQNIVKYTGDFAGAGQTYRIRYDFDKSSAQAGFGIRFVLDSSMGNYYQLWISGHQDLGQTGNSLWQFKKTGDTNVVNSVAKTSSATSGDGSIVSGSVEIIVDGGNISWTVSGKRLSGMDYYETGTYVDANPFVKDDKSGIGFFTTGGGHIKAYIDNFTIEKVTAYTDFIPANVFMKNVATGINQVKVDNAYVRKVYLPAAANSTVELQMDDKTVEANFDAEGWWSYLGEVLPVVDMTVPDTYDCTDMLVLVETKNDFANWIYTGTPQKVMYPLLGGSMDASTMNWSSSDDSVATVDKDGYVTGLKAGQVTITAEKNGVAYTCALTLRGEIDKAADMGALDAYFADKKPVVDAMNAATTAAEMETILTGTDATSLSYIEDIDRVPMQTLLQDGTKLTPLANKMLTHKGLTFASKEDLVSLQAILDKEVAATYFDNLTAIADVQGYVDTYYDTLDLNSENYYYLMYKDGTASAMLNQTYDDAIDVKDTMEEAYVMLAFADSIAYSKIQDILTKCEDEIGYDDVKLAQNGITNVANYLLENKDTITTRAQLKAAIDGYVAPVVDGGSDGIGGSSSSVGSSGGSSGGFGGGLGGGSVYTGGNSYGADDELVQDAAQLPIVDDEPLFADVAAEDWFFEAVAMLKGKGIVNGYEDNTFVPDASVTRAEFVKMLIGVLEIAPVEVAAPAEGEAAEGEEAAAPAAAVFTDVTEADWHYGYMMAAYENGLIYGDENGAANPDALITREEMATMIQRAMDLKAVPFESVNKGQVFTDDAAISDWAYSAVISVKNAGIINGYADGSFRPADNATRAESAQVLSGFATTLDTAIEAAEAAAAQAAAEAEA